MKGILNCHCEPRRGVAISFIISRAYRWRSPRATRSRWHNGCLFTDMKAIFTAMTQKVTFHSSWPVPQVKIAI